MFSGAFAKRSALRAAVRLHGGCNMDDNTHTYSRRRIASKRVMFLRGVRAKKGCMFANERTSASLHIVAERSI